MTAQIWKSAGSDLARVTFACPWCDVTGTAPVLGHTCSPLDEWLLVGCPAPDCGRGVLIRMPRRAATWKELETGADGLLLDRNSILPPQLPSFRAEGVPAPIAHGMKEALRCQTLGQHRAAVLVALAVVEAATRSAGAREQNPARAIRALADRLSPPLIDWVDEICCLTERPTLGRIGPGEVDRLLIFVTELLHQLFSVPAMAATSG